MIKGVRIYLENNDNPYYTAQNFESKFLHQQF